MKQEKVWREFMALSPELQQQVIDFIAFLRTRYMATSVTKTAARTKLKNESFIGMWRNRQHLHDSTGWVREIRQREWVNRNG